MHIKDLCKKAHKIAVEKGFWDGERIYNENGKHYPPHLKIATRNISELLMLCVSELGEACEALRKNNRQHDHKCKSPIHKSKFSSCPNTWTKDTFEDEIADVFIRLGDMCEALGIDIEWQIRKKMDYNKTRSQKHGKEF